MRDLVQVWNENMLCAAAILPTGNLHASNAPQREATNSLQECPRSAYLPYSHAPVPPPKDQALRTFSMGETADAILVLALSAHRTIHMRCIAATVAGSFSIKERLQPNEHRCAVESGSQSLLVSYSR